MLPFQRCVRAFSTSVTLAQQNKNAMSDLLSLINQPSRNGNQSIKQDFINSAAVQRASSISPHQIPRTGVLAQRTVAVQGGSKTVGQALRQLNTINSQNRVIQTVFRQQRYERPCKKRARISMERSKKRFDRGIKRLFGLVEEARRRGY